MSVVTYIFKVSGSLIQMFWKRVHVTLTTITDFIQIFCILG